MAVCFDIACQSNFKGDLNMDYSSMKKILASLIVLGALPSCTDTDKTLHTPGIDYKKSNTIMLNVNNLQVISVPNAHQPKNRHIQEENKIFREEVEKWAHRRLSAQGGMHRAVLTITKANIRLMREDGISRDDYEGKVDVKLDILDDRGYVVGTVSAMVDHVVGVSDTFTVHEKRAQAKKLREEIINALDAKMVKEISQHMTAFAG